MAGIMNFLFFISQVLKKWTESCHYKNMAKNGMKIMIGKMDTDCNRASKAEEDEEIYDKMACWCETNDKEKTKSIADAEAKIEDLTTKIEEYTAASARLGTEIKNLEKEVAANQEALDKATAIREKQLAEFNAEEKDLLQSISALKSAVVVLVIIVK